MWYEAVVSILVGIGFLILCIGLLYILYLYAKEEKRNLKIKNELYITLTNYFKSKNNID